MHRIRERIIQTIGRSAQRLSEEKWPNSKRQTTTEEASEALTGNQTIRRDLTKGNNSRHPRVESRNGYSASYVLRLTTLGSSQDRIPNIRESLLNGITMQVHHSF
jgi:hypothetical protein